MAATKTTTFSETITSYSEKTSSLTVNIHFSANNTSTYFTNYPLNCTVDGVTKTQRVSHPKGGSCSASFTFDNIQHDSSGNKTVSWSWSCATGTNGLGTVTDSGTRNLVKIAGASQVHATSFYVGDEVAITIDKPAGSSFVYDVGYSFIDDITYFGTIEEKTPNSTVYWTPNSTSLLTKMSKLVSTSGNIICRTYANANDTEPIGTTICPITATVRRINPTVSLTIEDTNPSTVDFTNDNTKIIKYLSKPKVTVNATAKQHADIKSYSISADGLTYYKQEHSFNNGIVNPEITVNAMDTRNWDNPISYDLSENEKWINYEKVILNCEYCERIEQTSSTIKCKLVGTFFNNTINGTSNVLELFYRRRKQGEEWSDVWTTIPSTDITINGNNFTFQTNSLQNDCSDLESWEFQFKAKDILMTTPIITKQITLGLGVLELAKEFANFNVDLFVKDYPVVTAKKIEKVVI